MRVFQRESFKLQTSVSGGPSLDEDDLGGLPLDHLAVGVHQVHHDEIKPAG